MTEYISRETLRDLMYTEAFERDTGLTYRFRVSGIFLMPISEPRLIMQIKTANPPDYSTLARVWMGILAHKAGGVAEGVRVEVKNDGAETLSVLRGEKPKS